mmetsp:Transcript_11453/g.14921  ORF Transcript_11453/g.14921 Transcript_11453/m.14921 type:complete len:255 (+) Transcript_11453:207-971(+)
MQLLFICTLCTLLMTSSNAFNSFFSSPETKVTSPKSKSPMFEYLKFDGKPKFDVLAKTKEYVESLQSWTAPEDIFAEDYVLRGPVIGPINRADLATSQKGLGIREAFPDLKIETFGYTIDPENPYRCFYFQRWRGTHTGDLDNYGTVYPATMNEMETPVSVFSVVFNSQGKIVYEQVGAVVDRLEGNTQGKAAIFGMLHTAGLKLNANPGDKVFAFIQRVGHFVGGLGRSWSREEDIPEWWTSKSRGADETDQF